MDQHRGSRADCSAALCFQLPQELKTQVKGSTEARQVAIQRVDENTAAGGATINVSVHKVE